MIRQGIDCAKPNIETRWIEGWVPWHGERVQENSSGSSLNKGQGGIYKVPNFKIE